MDNKIIFENWRRFISEAEDSALGAEEKKGKELAKKSKRNLQKLSPKDKEALEQLRQLLPAMAMAALDAQVEDTSEGRVGGRTARHRRARRQAALKAMGLPKETKKSDLSPDQKRVYDEQIKQWNARSQQVDYMTSGVGGQTNLLLTQLDELPLIKKIPGISVALMALFGTDDLTIMGALEALTSITGPLGI